MPGVGPASTTLACCTKASRGCRPPAFARGRLRLSSGRPAAGPGGRHDVAGAADRSIFPPAGMMSHDQAATPWRASATHVRARRLALAPGTRHAASHNQQGNRVKRRQAGASPQTPPRGAAPWNPAKGGALGTLHWECGEGEGAGGRGEGAPSSMLDGAPSPRPPAPSPSPHSQSWSPEAAASGGGPGGQSPIRIRIRPRPGKLSAFVVVGWDRRGVCANGRQRPARCAGCPARVWRCATLRR